jgi:hypothetical protein
MRFVDVGKPNENLARPLSYNKKKRLSDTTEKCEKDKPLSN